MTTKPDTHNLQDHLRQANERLLLSAFNAQDDADRANASLALLEAVLRQMPNGVIIADPVSEGIVLSNEIAQSLWPDCVSVADMARYFESRCFHVDGGPCNSDELPLSRSMRSGEQIAREEVRFLRKDGSHGVMALGSGPVRDISGYVVSVVLTCEDVTEQNAIAEREQAALLQLRDLSAKLESAREEERTRIARELHDEMGQSLTALNFDLAWLLKQIPMQRKAVRKKIESMIEATKRTIANARQLASDLRPSILDTFGLVPAIEWQLSEFEQRTGISVNFECQGDRDVDRESSTVVFRIVQEALTNVMRHAHATEVDVRLTTDDHCLTLQLRDNGRGIRPAEIACLGSLGIVGMSERVIRLGGRFMIEPQSAGGTRLEVFIPLAVGGASQVDR